MFLNDILLHPGSALDVSMIFSIESLDLSMPLPLVKLFVPTSKQTMAGACFKVHVSSETST